MEIQEIFDLIKRSSLGDALMTCAAKKHLPFVSTMVSWDDSHFKIIFPGIVLTPKAYLKGLKE